MFVRRLFCFLPLNFRSFELTLIGKNPCTVLEGGIKSRSLLAVEIC